MDKSLMFKKLALGIFKHMQNFTSNYSQKNTPLNTVFNGVLLALIRRLCSWTLSQFQSHTPTTWAVIHITMRFNKVFEREYFHLKRRQHSIGG